MSQNPLVILGQDLVTGIQQSLVLTSSLNRKQNIDIPEGRIYQSTVVINYQLCIQQAF